jgi:hypothetical protein
LSFKSWVLRSNVPLYPNMLRLSSSNHSINPTKNDWLPNYSTSYPNDPKSWATKKNLCTKIKNKVIITNDYDHLCLSSVAILFQVQRTISSTHKLLGALPSKFLCHDEQIFHSGMEKKLFTVFLIAIICITNLWKNEHYYFYFHYA